MVSLQQICGHAVINGGFSGPAIGYFERHAAELLGSAHPWLIVLAVRINNASTAAAENIQSHYDATVGTPPVTSAKVAWRTLIFKSSG